MIRLPIPEIHSLIEIADSRYDLTKKKAFGSAFARNPMHDKHHFEYSGAGVLSMISTDSECTLRSTVSVKGEAEPWRISVDCSQALSLLKVDGAIVEIGPILHLLNLRRGAFDYRLPAGTAPMAFPSVKTATPRGSAQEVSLRDLARPLRFTATSDCLRPYDRDNIIALYRDGRGLVHSSGIWFAPTGPIMDDDLFLEKCHAELVANWLKRISLRHVESKAAVNCQIQLFDDPDRTYFRVWTEYDLLQVPTSRRPIGRAWLDRFDRENEVVTFTANRRNLINSIRIASALAIECALTFRAAADGTWLLECRAASDEAKFTNKVESQAPLPDPIWDNQTIIVHNDTLRYALNKIGTKAVTVGYRPNNGAGTLCIRSATHNDLSTLRAYIQASSPASASTGELNPPALIGQS